MSSSLSGIITTIAPWLTAALGGPVGLATQAASTVAKALGLGDASVNGVTTALSSLTLSPADKLALQSAENDFTFKMKAAGYADKEALAKMDLDEIATVNATMVAELQNADKEGWAQKNWRAYCGLTVAFTSAGAALACCALVFEAIFVHNSEALGAIPELANGVALILAIPGAAVGINAWHKGVVDTVNAKNDANK